MIGALITLLIYILIIGIVVWLALYIIGLLPLPAPFGQIATAIVIVVACLVLIMLLLNVLGAAGGLGHLSFR